MNPSGIPIKSPQDITKKKELSAAFFSIGLVTVITGLAGILIGIWLQNQYKAETFISILPLVIGLPIVLIINFLITRKTILKINSQSRK
jgi:hypothetical protein